MSAGPDERPKEPDVFISYVSADLKRAELLYERLKVAGFIVWFDRARLFAGCRWYDEIAAGCEATRLMLPLLTPGWRTSEWTRFETYMHEAVIPILAQGRPHEVMPPPLRGIQAVMFDPLAPDEAVWSSLVATIRDTLAKPRTERVTRLIELPYKPNPYFRGRESEIVQIHELLHTVPTATLSQGNVQALAAIGGVGKTTLANEYAHRFWRCYRQIFWVDAKLGLESEFARLCALLYPEIDFSGLTMAEKARRTLEVLGGSTKRLLVIDNAPDAETVRPFLPREAESGCRTIVTSRFSDWPKAEGVGSIVLGVLGPGHSCEFFAHRTGQSLEGDERQSCEELAKTLGYLPLALEQAAAYIVAAGGMRFSEYLELYRDVFKTLLAEKVTGSTQYPDSVLTTWTATVRLLGPEARGILQLCAWYADTPLPKSLIFEGAAEVLRLACQFGRVSPAEGGAADKHRMIKAIAELAKFSMILDVTQETFRFHALVQTVERVRVGRDGQGHEAMDISLTRMAQAFPYVDNEPMLWPLCRTLMPHQRQLLTYDFPADAVPRLGYLLNHAARFLQDTGDATSALRLFKLAFEMCERVEGFEHRNTLTILNNLTSCLLAVGKATEALPLCRKALIAQTRLLGPEHKDSLRGANNLAACLHDLGRNQEALPILEMVYSVYERVLGVEHCDTLSSINNMASCLRALDRSREALPMFLQTVGGYERALGPDHLRTIMSIDNLALCLQDLNRTKEALPLHQRSLEARERTLGLNHPETLNSIVNLAGCLKSLGRLGDALALNERALATSERVLGPEHPKTLGSLNNLASCLRDAKRPLDALPLFRRGRAALMGLYGPEHPSTLTMSDNLALCLLSLDIKQEALNLLKETLAARERVLGADHFHTVKSVNHLAACLSQLGRANEALPLNERALSALKSSLGQEHPDSISSLFNFANCLEAVGQIHDALPHYKRAVELAERVIGISHPNTELFRQHYLACSRKQR